MAQSWAHSATGDVEKPMEKPMEMWRSPWRRGEAHGDATFSRPLRPRADEQRVRVRDEVAALCVAHLGLHKLLAPFDLVNAGRNDDGRARLARR